VLIQTGEVEVGFIGANRTFGKMVRPACLDRGGLPATGQSI